MIETYITHVRIIEDSQYPYSQPPPTSTDATKKHRLLIIAVRKSGRVRVHKARQNNNNTFQIGKTWNLEDLTSIENDIVIPTGFTMNLGKHYYWATQSPREKAVFINSTIRIFTKYTGGKVPELIGFENFGTPPSSPNSTRAPSGTTSAIGAAVAAAAAAAAGSGTTVTHHPIPSQPPQQSQPQPQERRPSAGAPPIPIPPRERRPSLGAAQTLNQRPGEQPLVSPIPAGAAGTAGPRPPQLQKRPSIGNNLGGGVYRNDSLNKSQDSIAIPPKSTSRSSQLRKVESQPRLNRIDPVAEIPPMPKSRSHAALANVPMAKGKEPFTAASLGLAGASMAAAGAIGVAAGVAGGAASGATAIPRDVKLAGRPPQPQQGPGSLQGPSLMIPKQQLPQPFTHTQQRPKTPPSVQIPAVTLNSDEQPMDFTSPVRPAPGANRSDAAALGVPRVIADQFDDRKATSQSGSAESSILASGIVFDSANKRSSVSSIKIFAHRREDVDEDDDHEDEAQDTFDMGSDSKSGNSRDASQVRFQADDKSQLSVGDDNDSEESLNSRERARKNELVRSRMTFIAANNASVIEETLGELNWTGRNDVNILEYKISNEIAGLETQKLRNIVELDDRLDYLDQSLDSVIKECDRLEAIFAFFAVQLGSFSDQISHIEGQGQGLQVQTRNQKVLWTELSNIIHTVSLPSEALKILSSYNLQSNKDLSVIENVLVDLYRAVKAVRSSSNNTIDESGESLGNMRALKEKRHIYEQAATDFMQKFKMTVDARVSAAVSEAENRIAPLNGSTTDPVLFTIEEGVYKGLVPLAAVILFVKNIDELNYFSILRSYETQVKAYYEDVTKAYFAKWVRQIGKINSNTDNLFLSRDDGHAGYPNGGGAGSSVAGGGTIGGGSIGGGSKLIRSQTLAKMKPHSDRGVDRSNSISSSSPVHIHADSSDLSLLMKPSAVRSSVIKAIQAVRSLIIKEQVILIEVYHLSSFSGTRFPDYVKAHSLAQRRIEAGNLTEKIYGIDADRLKAQDLLNLMTGIFSPLQEHLVRFSSDLLEQSVMDCPAVLLALDIVLKELQTTNLDFLNMLYQRIRDRVISIWNGFVSKQVAKIGQALVSSKKRTGPISAVKVFSLFCQRIEYDLTYGMNASKETNLDDLEVRGLVNDAYEKLGKTIITTLQKTKASMAHSESVGIESGKVEDIDYEDKIKMNYHILMIENMNVFLDGLLAFDRSNRSIHNLREMATKVYYQEMRLYVEFVLHRPFGKLMDFLENVEQVMRKNSDDNPSKKPGLNRSALKKILINFDAKELRKLLEVLHKRVEKHFMEDPTSAGSAQVGGVAGGAGASGTGPAATAAAAAAAAASTNGASAAALSANRKLVSKVWAETEREFTGIVRRFRPYIDRFYSMAGDSGYVCKIDFTDAEISEAFRSVI